MTPRRDTRPAAVLAKAAALYAAAYLPPCWPRVTVAEMVRMAERYPQVRCRWTKCVREAERELR